MLLEKLKLISHKVEESNSTFNKWLLFDIIVLIFFAALCSSVPSSFFAREFQKKGGSYVLAAVIIQIYPVAIAATAWIFGKLIPQFGYKPIVIFGVLLEGTSQIVFAFATYIEDISTYTAVSIVMRILSGTGNAAALTTALAIAVTDFGNHSTFILSVIESITGVSYLFGPIIGAALYKVNNSMFTPLLIPGIAYLLSVIRFAIFYKPSESQDEYSVVKLSLTLKILFNKTLIGPTFIQMCIVGTFGYIAVYLTVYVKKLGMTVIDAGLIISISAISYMIVSLIAGRVIPRYPRHTIVIMAIGITAWTSNLLCLTVTSKSLGWVVYVGYSLIGTFESVINICVYQYSLYHLRHVDMGAKFNEKMSCIAGIWVSCTNLGKFLFATIGGLVIQLTGSVVYANVGFVILGCIISCATCIAVLINKFHR